MKKKLIASVLALGLVAGIAYAHSGGYGMGGHRNGGHMMGYGMNNGMGSGPMMQGGYNMRGRHMGGSSGYANCPGAAAFNNNGNSGNNGWNSASHQKFLNDTVELRQEMNDKRFEYMEARRNPNAGRDQLAALEKELNDIQLQLQLQLQLQNKAQQYR
ncbi:MAG: hypothetical protein ABR512_02430 [Desulfopila sp.]